MPGPSPVHPSIRNRRLRRPARRDRAAQPRPSLRRAPRAERSLVPDRAEERKPPAMASKAIVGEKVGMTQGGEDANRAVPSTMVKVAPLRIVQVKTLEHDGYNAVQVTFGTRNART